MEHGFLTTSFYSAPKKRDENGKNAESAFPTDDKKWFKRDALQNVISPMRVGSWMGKSPIDMPNCVVI